MALGSIIAFTPAVGFTWPALLPAALLAGSALGYDWVENPEKAGLPVLNKIKRKLINTQIVTVDVREELANRAEPINIEIMEEELQSDQELIWTRGETTLIFRKDTRGELFVSAMGPKSMSKKELRDQAKEFARETVRNFALNKVVTELEKASANVVEESVNDEGDVVLKLRRWI
jgi:RNA-binding protein YhbY